MDFNSVKGKVAIVTGASRGIGRAIAECFGENGMKVVCAARSAEQGRAVADGICAKGGDAIFIQTDCSKASAIKELVDKTVTHYGKLDGVVSNAGIGMGGTPLHEYEVEDYEKIFSLNSEGVFAGMKYGAEAILKSHSEGGFLINVASVAGLVPQRGQALYSATKFGVVGMTRAAALDYAEYGITVNAICPGYTRTSIFGDAPAAAMDFFAADCPAKRMGDPEECAALALFLASGLARYITGAAIPVDGALSAGHQSISSWKHPEILTGGKLNSQSTIAALMENEAAKAIVEQYLPGFAGMKYGAEAILKSHSEGGFLINVASVAGLVPQRGQALYSATKFGVVGMTRAAALDYAEYGITVNAICPGYTRTSIFGDAPAAAMDFFAADCPAKRMGDPEECAALALFLASGLARYITGAAIPVDGALSAGHQSISSWKHPEILTGGKLNSQSTIAALMENEAAKAIVEQYLPGFADNQQAKAAYGMTFGKIGPMLGLPETALKALLDALDNL